MIFLALSVLLLPHLREEGGENLYLDRRRIIGLSVVGPYPSWHGLAPNRRVVLGDKSVLKER